MSDSLPDSLIPYDDIVQEALRAVVGRVLGSVAENGGLPGAHHFFIDFRTQAPGVSIPLWLASRYPDEMRIVMQNQYWDLVVEDDRFSVGLSFGGVQSNLVIPYAAITGFHDPAVSFELRFQAQDGAEDPEPQEAAQNDAVEAKPVEDGSNVVAVDFKRKK